MVSICPTPWSSSFHSTNSASVLHNTGAPTPPCLMHRDHRHSVSQFSNQTDPSRPSSFHQKAATTCPCTPCMLRSLPAWTVWPRPRQRGERSAFLMCPTLSSSPIPPHNHHHRSPPFPLSLSHPLSPRQLLPTPITSPSSHHTTSKSTHSPAGDFRWFEERSKQETNGTRTSSHKRWIAALDWQIFRTASWVNWTTQ